MIIPNAEYMEGVCAWLDGKVENPYMDEGTEPKLFFTHQADPRAYDWFAGWIYANVNYGIKQYGKV